MHGPEELLALLKVMLLTARPVLSIVETQYLPPQQDESSAGAWKQKRVTLIFSFLVT